MRLEWLEDILAVAETGSFTEAAERRRLTQSAFSRRIQGIEEFIGVELFDRTRKPIHLRPSTEHQRKKMVHIVAQLRQLTFDLRAGDAALKRNLVIVSQHALSATLTPAILWRLEDRHQDVIHRLLSADFDECFSHLLARRAHIAVVYRLPRTEHPIGDDFAETLAIDFDRMIPVIGSGKVKEFCTSDDRDFSYIAYPRDVFFGEVMERLILPQIPKHRHAIPKVETALTLGAMEMAAIGVGVSWVPQSLAVARVSDGRLIDLSSTLPSCELEVTAVRLRGETELEVDEVWAQITGKAVL